MSIAQTYTAFSDPQVAAVYASFPDLVQDEMMNLRELILQTAKRYEQIGNIEETLKWGEPSYLTHHPKTGTTLRLTLRQATTVPVIALSVHCQSTLISDFKALYPNLNYDAQRSLIMAVDAPLETAILEEFIFLALTYHYRKRQKL